MVVEHGVGVGPGVDAGQQGDVLCGLSPCSSELRTSTALAKAWCWAADSRPASRKWRTVKYESPPMRMERISAPSPKTAVMRAPMPSFTQGTSL